MKLRIFFAVALAATGLFITGCETEHENGPYASHYSKAPPLENSESFVLLDPGVEYSVSCTGTDQRLLEDGRLEVIALLRNRENRRIEVQVNCVFKDLNGFSTGDETPFQTVILTENATEHIRFVSMNDQAKKYTIRVRQAR